MAPDAPGASLGAVGFLLTDDTRLARRLLAVLAMEGAAGDGVLVATKRKYQYKQYNIPAIPFSICQRKSQSRLWRLLQSPRSKN